MTSAVLLVSSDLFFISKIKEAAANCSLQVVVARSQVALEKALPEAQGSKGLFIIDLEKVTAPLEFLSRIVAELSGRGWSCVSFFSHVHLETAAQAEALALGEVMPRSRFVKVLPDLLASL